MIIIYNISLINISILIMYRVSDNFSNLQSVKINSN